MADEEDVELTIEQIREAVSRGWSTEENRDKEIDVALAEAITQEIVKLLGLEEDLDVA